MVSFRPGLLPLALERAAVLLLPASPYQPLALPTQALQVLAASRQVGLQLMVPLRHSSTEAARQVLPWLQTPPVGDSMVVNLRALRPLELLPRGGSMGEARLALLILQQVYSREAMMASLPRVLQQQVLRALPRVSQALLVRRSVS
jgi:hypothetical protein